MVGLGGLEPPTSPLSGARSSHLSYRPFQTSEENCCNSFSLRCLTVICNCAQTVDLCTRHQLLRQSTLLLMLKVGVNAGDFQTGMTNLRSNEVTDRPAVCIWLARPCLNACMVPTGMLRRLQRGFKNFLLISLLTSGPPLRDSKTRPVLRSRRYSRSILTVTESR